MKISYRKNSGISYMVIEGCDGEESPFFMKMASLNNIPHLLPLKHEKINSQTYFLYDITGKRSLEKTFETRKMSYDIFLSLMMSLRTLSDELSELLLDSDRVILRPDAVFLNHSCNDFWFCADPGASPDPRQFIKDFFNRLLSVIDYDDKRLAALVFSLSRLTQNEYFTMQDLLSADISTGYEAVSSSPSLDEQPVLPDQDSSRQSFIDKARFYFRGKTFSEVYDAINSGRIFRLIKETDVPQAPVISREIPLPALMEETAYPAEKDPLSDTAPLNISEMPFHRLNGLDNAEGMVILLDHFPFTIGKEGDSVDFHLDRPTVSRTHCRLYENEDGSFGFEDLNSRNGSYINSASVDPYSRQPLLPGDTVTLADMRFIFL